MIVQVCTTLVIEAHASGPERGQRMRRYEMTYESETHSSREADVLSAWGVYALTVAVLAVSSVIHLFS